MIPCSFEKNKLFSFYAGCTCTCILVYRLSLFLFLSPLTVQALSSCRYDRRALPGLRNKFNSSVVSKLNALLMRNNWKHSEEPVTSLQRCRLENMVVVSKEREREWYCRALYSPVSCPYGWGTLLMICVRGNWGRQTTLNGGGSHVSFHMYQVNNYNYTYMYMYCTCIDLTCTQTCAHAIIHVYCFDMMLMYVYMFVYKWFFSHSKTYSPHVHVFALHYQF